MIDLRKYSTRGVEVNSKVAQIFPKRASVALEHLVEHFDKAIREHGMNLIAQPLLPLETLTEGLNYTVDLAQRSTLFWDTVRQRGNNYIAHEKAGKPPVLHFKYETVLDARKFERPVNYALLRIIPPEGVTTDPKRRPYIIIDPRAGHGPGIGGFKDDSQVGVAIRDGHPVYFVIFFPEPEPGQTLIDVTVAEQQFVRKVRELHPDSAKPVLVGNCQGGWAAMMLAAADPNEIGPIVINGAPMSYWGGAWSEGEGDNPMRYNGGLMGGTWLASLCSDVGNGIFDGASLVQNFENLNPANSLWDKYYHLFANIDTEPPRYLEFERWWGGYYLLSGEEMDWIAQNLFVGNRIWSGGVRSNTGQAFDLRQINTPIVLFASLGDNITPPQQAFNWVADIYGSTEEIKSRGQVIVGLLHKNIGHLGIFVSGKVAKKEHKQIVSVLKSIEALPPGLYGMQILEQKQSDGKMEYEVQFVEHRLEEITQRLNRFKRADEKPFQVAERIAEFNQDGYDLFARPFVQAMANPFTAELSRMLHPMRVQHWALSDLNPWLAWIRPLAGVAKANRRTLAPESPIRQAEQMASDIVSGSLDFFREIRDASCESLFFQIYANLYHLYFSREEEAEKTKVEKAKDAQELPFIKEALAAMAQGGYPEAVARVFSLLAKHGAPLPLSQFALKRELAERYADLLPATTLEQQRRIRGEQDIIVHYAPQRALETLPHLLTNNGDREKLDTLLNRVLEDKRVQQFQITPEQMAMLGKIQKILGKVTRRAAPRRRRGTTPKTARGMQPA